MLQIGGQDVLVRHRAACGVRAGAVRPCRKRPRGKIAYLAKAGIAAHGDRVFPHELHAVVVGGVVTRGDHYAAVDAKGEGGEIHLFSAHLADVHHVHAHSGEAGDKGSRQGCTTQTHVAPHDHPPGSYELREPPAYEARQFLVEFARHTAAHVVRFEQAEIRVRSPSQVLLLAVAL